MARPLDQDDLDDLDDVLDQFSRQPAPPTPSSATLPVSPISAPPPPPPPTATQPTFTGGHGRPRTNTRVDAPPIPAPGNGLPTLGEGDDDDADADALAADFAKELAKGMESLMREIAEGQTPAGDTTADADTEAEAARFKAAWEAMLVQEMDGTSGNAASETAAAAATASGSSGPAPEVDDFQAKIRAAMNKVNEGESTLKSDSAASGSAPAPDSLEALLAQLNELGGEGDAGLPTDETELAGFLENMMGELMSKDVLYEPLTELAEKFPPYLATHSPDSAPPLSAEDRTRYESQLARVREILAIFDASGFSDEDKAAREKVVALMAEMQSFGSPPTELMGPLPPGLGALGGEECVVC
ncbi:Pex19 protein family-domain-containing protein [Favolaschia claudopus]|uniref:Pex19 protein family-domain-containing protein n=1 Tax=Favolaschia claudopus TaxID=2862362 RepID=A0AAW0BRY0_9AGAR